MKMKGKRVQKNHDTTHDTPDMEKDARKLKVGEQDTIEVTKNQDLPIDKGWAWVVLAAHFVMTIGLQKFSSRVSVCLGGILTVVGYAITAFATDIRQYYFAQGILCGLLMRPIELYSLRRNKGDSKKEEDTSVIFGDGKDHDKSINKARGEITDTNYDLDDELDVDDERETAFKGSGKSLDQRLKNAAMQSYDVDIANRNQQGSPLISRARAHSYNAKRSRTLSECTEVSKSTLTKVIQAIDRSEVALYASGECIFGSFIGINSARKHLS
ncbi:uncharacterized protein LOC127834259 isoform X2 [Dreissena polymorpha]|uniref:uncharacterized protein LOC127834259 isoform X2 n=1 Tax=Dreissena polymorpha TaxID=45954 RepID=UPI0022647395|nr:uncharacterized protein LOC127834259 isoform X2 [Dreissena polymorpha]